MLMLDKVTEGILLDLYFYSNHEFEVNSTQTFYLPASPKAYQIAFKGSDCSKSQVTWVFTYFWFLKDFKSRVKF